MGSDFDDGSFKKSRSFLLVFSSLILVLWYFKAEMASLSILGNTIKFTANTDNIWLVLAVAAKDEKVHFVDVRTNSLMATSKLPSPVYSLTFSHRGDTLLLSTASGQVLLYDWPSLKLRHTVEAHASAAMCLELDPRGAHLAVGGSDAVVGIWDTEEWVCLRTLRMMDAPVKRVTLSYDGQYICTATDEPSQDIDFQDTHYRTNARYHHHQQPTIEHRIGK